MSDTQIELLIRRLGIRATYRGYHYLVYAIKLCLSNPDYLLSVGKLLYPEIAKEFQTSSSSVERNLRTVISVCWDRGNQSLLQGISIYPLFTKPSCSEFLDVLVHYFR